MVTEDQWLVQGWQSEKNREGVSEAQSRLLFLCQPSEPLGEMGGGQSRALAPAGPPSPHAERCAGEQLACGHSAGRLRHVWL